MAQGGAVALLDNCLISLFCQKRKAKGCFLSIPDNSIVSVDVFIKADIAPIIPYKYVVYEAII